MKRRGSLRRGKLSDRRHGDRESSRRKRRNAKLRRKGLRRTMRRRGRTDELRLATTAPLVVTRARGRCERCRALTHPHELEVHHLVPRSRGVGWAGLHEPENLAALCGGPDGCHARVHDHRAPDWRRWILPRPADEDAA